MKKIVMKIVALAMIVASVFAMTACGTKPVNIRTKTIVVGYTDYKPMNYTENNELKGFDTELALMVFNALGYEVKFTLIDWSNKYNELESNSIDCVWNGFTMNSEDEINGTKKQRADIVDFTKPYMNNAQCIIRKSSTAAVATKAALAGKSVAYESGSAGEDYITGVKAGATDATTDDINIQLVPMTAQMDAVKEVNTGSADYAVVDINLARSIAGKGNFTEIVINESEDALELPQEYYAVAFKKGSKLDEQVNIMLNAFAQTGQLKALAEKYEIGEVVILDGYLD